MKGPTRRFLNHKGRWYCNSSKPRADDDFSQVTQPSQKREKSINFLQLWRYADIYERLMSLFSVLLALCSSGGLVIAVLIYGELTALFVQRAAERGGVTRAPILGTLGGGTIIDDDATRSDHMDALLADSVSFAWWSAITIAIQIISAALSVYLAEWAAHRMTRRIRWMLLRAMLKQEMSYFDTERTLDLNTALTEQVENLRNGVGAHVPQCVYLGGAAAAGAGVAVAAGWHLALTALAVVPIAVLVATTVSNYATRCSNEEVRAYGEAGKCAEETIAGVRAVRAWGGAEGEVHRYQEAVKGASGAGSRRGTAAAVGAGAAWLLTYSLNSVVFAYGATLIVGNMHLPSEDRMYHPGTMITVLFLTFMCAQNIAMLHPHLEVMSGARSAAGPLYALLERKPEVDALDTTGLTPHSFRGDIQLKNLYFNYPSRPDVKVLRGLNLEITAGQTVALVGSSGCGKSTILQLLQRLYEPDSGSIVIDGNPLERLNLHHFRSCIGVVGQEPVLFGGTIRENITLGRENITDEMVYAAAKTAHAHHFITKLKAGYSTNLGSGGAQLSGGQKQRIAIARALVRNPSILLLDEPTSALDPVSEKQVQAALDAASIGRTTIVVSHRLSTILNASSIVYMEQGAVVEKGTYTELMMKKGAFFDLANTDMQQQQRPAPAQYNDDDDVVQSSQLKRTPSNGSTWSCRRSFRVASAGSLRIPAASAPNDFILDEEVLEEERSSSDNDEVASSRVSTWDLLRLNAPEWRLLVGGGIASFLIGATMPVFALLFSKLYGMFSLEDGAAILSQAYIFAGGFAAVAALCGLVTFLQTLLFNRAGSRLTDRLRIETFKAYLKQEQAWFDQPQNSVGALCSRLANDCAAVQGATGTRLGTVLQGISTMVIGVTLAACFSWKMTFISLLSVPFVIGGIYVESAVSRVCESKSRKALNDAARIAAETIINIRTVHSLGAEYWALRRYESSLVAGHSRTWTTSVARGVVYGLSLCAPTLGYAVSLAYGGYLIAREGMQYENAILVSEALIYGAWMLAEALSFAPNFASARRSGGRLLAILHRRPAITDPLQPLSIKREPPSSSVVFDNVWFTYPSRGGAPVLRGVSVSVPSGKTLALVGPSGCGKSTLLQLLLRMYDPDQGNIYVSSLEIRSWQPAALRRQFALVQQEPALFARSITDNIAYGDLEGPVTEQDVIQAAKAAHVHQFIASLPAGYATPLGGGGAQLSGGQKQRIAIARALLRNPKVLLLDEPTSALDASSEKEVHSSLVAASRGRTTIMIAHRLATVRHADIICVLDQGKVVETGSHEELLALNGAYCRLLREQSDVTQTHGGDTTQT